MVFLPPLGCTLHKQPEGESGLVGCGYRCSHKHEPMDTGGCSQGRRSKRHDAVSRDGCGDDAAETREQFPEEGEQDAEDAQQLDSVGLVQYVCGFHDLLHF